MVLAFYCFDLSIQLTFFEDDMKTSNDASFLAVF